MEPKALIILIFPDLGHSSVHHRWILELNKFKDRYVIHNLYEAYPEGRIDVFMEQNMMKNFSTIVFQHPIFWFNCPPLLKQWLDEVLVQEWAFGSEVDTNLKERK